MRGTGFGRGKEKEGERKRERERVREKEGERKSEGGREMKKKREGEEHFLMNRWSHGLQTIVVISESAHRQCIECSKHVKLYHSDIEHKMPPPISN